MKKEIKYNKKKYLIFLDLDGTTLRSSATNEITENVKKAIKRVREAGHIVCISTGRPWDSTEGIYKELELDSVCVNLNGAYIHNPTDYKFQQQISSLRTNDVAFILKDKKFKEARENAILEGIGWVMMEKRDAFIEELCGIHLSKSIKTGLNYKSLPLAPLGVIVDMKKDVNIDEILDYLVRRYGDLAEFSTWSKGEGKSKVIDMIREGMSKSKAMSLLTRYYDIDVENTIAMGDGLNDLEMIKTAEIGVSMGQASKEIKDEAQFITKSNKEDGVSLYLNEFMDKWENL